MPTITPVQALTAVDRMNAGRVVFDGYMPLNVADLIHCLNIWLSQELAREPKRKTMIRRLKTEITWNVNRCSRALKGAR